MPVPKTFVLGLDKTASSSIVHHFQSNGLRKIRHQRWGPKLESGDVFSNCARDADVFETYVARFPDARFILNIRPLGAWLGSKFRHSQRCRPIGPEHPHMFTSRRRTRPPPLLQWLRDHPQDLPPFCILNVSKPSFRCSTHTYTPLAPRYG